MEEDEFRDENILVVPSEIFIAALLSLKNECILPRPL